MAPWALKPSAGSWQGAFTSPVDLGAQSNRTTAWSSREGPRHRSPSPSRSRDWPLAPTPSLHSISPAASLLARGSPVYPPDLIRTPHSSQWRGRPNPSGSPFPLCFFFRAVQASPTLHSLEGIGYPQHCDYLARSPITSSVCLSTYLYVVVPLSFPP